MDPQGLKIGGFEWIIVFENVLLILYYLGHPFFITISTPFNILSHLSNAHVYILEITKKYLLLLGQQVACHTTHYPHCCQDRQIERRRSLGLDLFSNVDYFRRRCNHGGALFVTQRDTWQVDSMSG